MKETVRQQMAQLMNIEKAGYVEPCQAQPTSYQSVRSAQVTTRAVHDLQVIKCDSRILSAIDEFWSQMTSVKCTGRANLVVTFNPQPPISTALALHQRLEAMGINVFFKGERGVSLPWGMAGGQKGQPCISVFMKDSTKITVQLQCRLGNLVVKGRRSAFTPDTVRRLIPFFGGAVSIKATSEG